MKLADAQQGEAERAWEEHVTTLRKEGFYIPHDWEKTIFLAGWAAREAEADIEAQAWDSTLGGMMADLAQARKFLAEAHGYDPKAKGCEVCAFLSGAGRLG